jgi:hypothetical protein
MFTVNHTAKLVFITICGLLNFIYVTVSSLVVFDYIFEKTGIFKNRLAAPETVRFLFPVQEGVITASVSDNLLIPLYVILGLLALFSVFMFLYFLIEIPKVIALFYMNRLEVFLFIDRNKTIRFFIMLALPLVNFISVSLSNQGHFRTDTIQSMILCTITHPGILILMYFVKSFKDKITEPGDKFKILKIAGANFTRASFLVVAAAYIILPYLLYYHFQTDVIQVGVFHIFLISAFYSNYRFYNENFFEIDAASDEDTDSNDSGLTL